jgi:hypothetical protein
MLYIEVMTPDAWLQRLGHDLVKRLLWPARDRRDLGGPVVPGELLRTNLVDDDGAPIGAMDLWQALRAEAPLQALDDFEAALARALASAAADDLDGVLALEAAYAQLARIVKGSR